MDFSTTNSTKTLRKQESSECSPGRETDREEISHLSVKSEPMEGGGRDGGPGGGGEDSNESAVISEPQIVTTEPDDSVHSGSLQKYFDNKLFAVAGASFNFSMAAALAADSLAGMVREGTVMLQFLPLRAYKELFLS